MFHEFYLTGSKHDLDHVEQRLSEKGVLSILSCYQDDDNVVVLQDLDLARSNFKNAKGIFSYQRNGNEVITIKVFFLCNNKAIYPGFCFSFSKAYPDINIKYRFYEKKNNFCGGLEFKNGFCVSEFVFNDIEDISYVITDYFCAIHIGLDKKSHLKLNGKVISEYMFDERAPGTNPIYVIEIYKVKLANNETLCFHMEFNQADPDCPSNVKKIDDTYKIYGLVNASWTLTGSDDEEEGLLHEHLTGNISENFNLFVPYSFALDYYNHTN